MSSYQAHGKFLLTGEYLVLKGALALALPLKLGQSMTVEVFSEASLQWNAYKPDGLWFSATLNPETLEIVHCDDPSKAERLAQILKAVRQLNPSAFEGCTRFETRLDFNPEWGLGSSSTLISNLARWAKVDPYDLLKLTFGGSGYDIACATADGPIYYQLPKVPEPVEGPSPKVEPIAFNPTFADHLFFIYQGQKQNSSKEVKTFLEKADPEALQKDIEAVSEISRSLPKCETLDDFGLLMQCQERIISRCIGQEPMQKRFSDFEGVLKSLGAWGGDFILAATQWDEKQVRAYFKEKGLEVVFGYNELVLNR
jgi:mevalonate kinase